LKPQAYLRYGDDFILFCPTRRSAQRLRDEAGNYLQSDLSLRLNPKNDVIVSAKSGLKFLGHDVTADIAVVDKHTTKNILPKITPRNISSYRSLFLAEAVKKQLDWILLEKYVDI
jgi:hypothetical protein